MSSFIKLLKNKLVGAWPSNYSKPRRTEASELVVGLGGFEPPTSPLSGVRSNQLSYRPILASSAAANVDRNQRLTGSKKGSDQRLLLMRQRTMILNAIRGHLAEFGIIAAQGPRQVMGMIARLRDDGDASLPEIARSALLALGAHLEALAGEIRALERQLMVWHRADPTSQRLETIPGVGLITATALAASVSDPSVFKSGREFAAFLGLVPRQNSSVGKDRLGRISKMGDRYLRKLLVVGATSVIRRAGSNPTTTGAWVRSLMERKPARVVTVAMANKTARIAWAVMTRGEAYRASPIA